MWGQRYQVGQAVAEPLTLDVGEWPAELALSGPKRIFWRHMRVFYHVHHGLQQLRNASDAITAGAAATTCRAPYWGLIYHAL